MKRGVGARFPAVLGAAAVLLLLTGFNRDVQAASLQIVPGVGIEMDAPEGLCQLVPDAAPVDTVLYNYMAKAYAGSNQLVGLFVDCDALASLRKGTPQDLRRWAAVLSPLINGQVQPATGYTRKRIADEMAKQFSTGLQGAVDSSKQSISDRLSGLLQGNDYQLDEAKSLGVLAQDDTATYAGLLLTQSLNGVQQRISGVIGMTLLRGYIVSYNLYGPYQGADTYTALVDEAKTAVAALIAGNGDEAVTQPPSWSPAGDVETPAADMPKTGLGRFHWGRILMQAAIMLVVAGFIGGLVYVVTRTRRKPSE